MAGKSRLFRGKAKRPILAAFAAALALFAFTGAANPAMAFAADETPSFAPGAYKSIKANNDGTYTLSLNVTGKQQSSEETVSQKADVILVMDVSGTMEGTKLQQAKDAANRLVEHLIPGDTSDDVNIALVPFGDIAKVRLNFNNNKSTIKGAINSLEVSDAKTGDKVGNGTNWEAGFAVANTITPSQQGAKRYIVFLSDGDPEGNYYHKDKQGNDVVYKRAEKQWGYESNGQWHQVQEADVVTDYESYYEWGWLDPDAAAGYAIAAGKKKGENTDLFSISFGKEGSKFHTRMQNLQEEITGSDKGCYAAANASELNKVFDDISSTIVKTAEFDKVVVTDRLSEWVSGVTNGTTSLTANGHVDSATFTYQKNGQPWTGSDVPSATVEADGTIKWDLSKVGSLEKDVTYTVSFTIAPNQEAFEKAVEGDGDNVPGVNLPTNGNAQVAFNIVETVNGQPTSKPADPVSIKSENIDVYPSHLVIEKKWPDGGSTPDSIQVQINQDGKKYQLVTLNASSDWKADILVAGGPEGHKYTFEELSVDGYDTTYSVKELTFQGLKDQRQFLTITNTRSKGTLYLTKLVNGNAANTNYAYDFVLTCETLKGQTFNATVDGEEVTVTFNEQTGVSNTIQLKHEQQLGLAGIPTGSEVSIKEINLKKDQAYSQTFAKSAKDEKGKDVNPNKAEQTDPFTVTIDKNGTQVTFTNTSKAAPNNGVSNSNITPMVGLFAAATIGGTALFAANRRKHGQDAWKE